MTRCVSLVVHLGKPGPQLFQWFPVHKHLNSKKPISFILNSRSSTIWPHLPLSLSVALVGSSFSLDWPCVVLPVIFASILFLSPFRTSPPIFLHWFKWGQVPPDHPPCGLFPPSCYRTSYAVTSFGNMALALPWLLSHLLEGRDSILPCPSSFLLSLIYSPAPHPPNIQLHCRAS